MADTIDDTNWDKFIEQGKQDSQVMKECIKLVEFYRDNLPDKPFEKDATDPLSFSKALLDELEAKFQAIFSQFNDLTQKQKNHWKEITIQRLKELFDLVIRKKALCTIEFKDSYDIYRFIQALTTISDEVRFHIQENQLFVSLYDDNIISLAKVEIYNDSFKFYRMGTAAVNLGDFEKLLKVNSQDNSQTTLTFGEDDVFISIYSRKYKISVERVLNQISLTSDTANFIKLDELEYCCNFEMSKEQLEYVITNIGRYSEVFSIECTSERLVYAEHGQIGSGSIAFTKEKVVKIEILKDDSESELKEREYFSLPYLKKLYKMCNILDKDNIIHFYLTKDQPLRCIVRFQKLGNTTITFYFAPRAERDDYEDQNGFDEINTEEGLESSEYA